MKPGRIRSSLNLWDIEQERVDEGVTAYAGLPVVIEAWYGLGLDKACHKHLKLRQRQRGLSDAQYAEVLAMLLMAGGRTVEDLESLQKDAGLCRLWPLAKEATPRSLLSYLHRFHDEEQPKAQQGRAHIPKESRGLQGLGRVNEALIAELQGRQSEATGTIDIDASIHESHKREALWTYDGVRGYQPVIAYWAEQGVIVADQFRDGNVPAGMGNAEVVRRTLRALPEGVTVRRVRGDSALYEQKVLRMLDREGIEFGISADVTEQLRQAMLAIPQEQWKRFLKPGKDDEPIQTDKQWAEVEFVPEDLVAHKGEKPFRYLGIRIPKDEPDLFEGAYRHFAVVTNRWDVDGNELLNWQRQRCGTVEWAHDVLKNDFAARVFPSGRFGANAAWYRFNVLAFNLKVALTRIGLPDYVRARPHTLRMRLLHLAARIICHARRLHMVFGHDGESFRQDLCACQLQLGNAAI
jgi:hypothetical protein